MTECHYPRPLDTFETGVVPESVYSVPLIENGLEEMSRFMDGELDDEWAVLAYGRWIARRNKVLSGRPGKAKLRELERALVNLPHHRLIHG